MSASSIAFIVTRGMRMAAISERSAAPRDPKKAGLSDRSSGNIRRHHTLWRSGLGRALGGPDRATTPSGS